MHLFSYPSPGARVMPARTGGSGLGFVVAGLTQPREIWWERAKKEASEVGAGATVNGAALFASNNTSKNLTAFAWIFMLKRSPVCMHMEAAAQVLEKISSAAACSLRPPSVGPLESKEVAKKALVEAVLRTPL